MADVLSPPRDISVLAPPREHDEALSSWLVRTADAHLLTVEELEREIGGSLSGLDRGDATLLPRLAAMTCTDMGDLAALAPADLAAHPMRAGPKPPHCWAVCPACLQEDQAQRRAPYVRRAWTHPLSAFCRAHNAPLVPHGNSRIKIASDLTLFGDGAEPVEPRDNLLDIVEFDDPGMIARVFRALDDSGRAEALEKRLRLRWAVRDVIDAMTTRMRDPAAGALVALLEHPIFQRRSFVGNNHMTEDCWTDIDAATRLLYVRLALLVLAEPGDPALNDRTSPLGPNWLLLRYRHTKIKGWQSLFAHAAPDPLFLLTMELPRNAILQLNDRSLAWPSDLRRRWTYAAAVGAIGGYVY
ncbi:hypothetical protein ASD79_07820 [Caulobacter sp. Root655]|uniref:TniQ family protein n=1 Tax=Caulobacter sp. Root655 TaxID=1736578 RepID=UPI0006F36D26|nr:TniQ family protein [Caulobacter sp. Root655]KRA60138.1 hypothetical protein ASD79_07820 [Caulobacter sp. Root655]